MSYISHIAIVGAGGQVGSRILKYCLKAPNFTKITALTRPDSTSTIPFSDNPKLHVARVDSKDHAALVKALTGVDALVITQSVQAAPETQQGLIDAGVKAGVRWILPNEWSSDGQNEKYNEAVPFMQFRKPVRARVETKAKELGKNTKWIAVCHGQWYDYSLAAGMYGIDIKNRVATFYDKGDQKASMTSLAQVGRGVAAMLSLPEEHTAGSKAALSDYANSFIYFRSFTLNQREVLDSVQRVTNTTDKDWELKSIPLKETLVEATKKLATGDYSALGHVIYGNGFNPDVGNLFPEREIANEKLGLPQEGVDEQTKKAVKHANESGKPGVNRGYVQLPIENDDGDTY